jgi:glycosyl hydrolase family 26
VQLDLGSKDSMMSFVSRSPWLFAAAALGLGACSDGADDTQNMATAGAASGGQGTSGSNAGPAGAGQVGTAGSLPIAGSASTAGTNGNTGGAGNTGGVATAGSSSGGVGTAGSAPSGGSATGGNVGTAGSGGSGGGGSSACGVSPLDPMAIPEAKNLLCYIYSIYGKSVLSGQQETSWSNPAGDIDYYVTTVSKHPAILGGDFLYQDGNKPGSTTTLRGIAYWQAGGISMMRFHMGAPPMADTYDNSKLSVANYDDLTVDGTAENTSLKSKLDYMAGELKVMQDAKVPVLMVPFHEVDSGAWFWWSKGTGPQFVKLWKYTVDYINKTKGIHNVIWIMGYGHDGAMPAYYPTGYTDLGGIDQYDKGTQPFATQFTSAKAVVGSTVPIPLHETGTIPQPSAMFPSAAPWVLWNVWATYQNTDAESYTWNTPESIKMAYADSHTITRETVPNLK